MTEQITEEQVEASAPNEVDVPVLTASVGDQLRAAREKAGMELSDIAKMLKLGERQLQALEDGDWARLPGATFIRGFVRNYARLVGLDPILLMGQLDLVLQKQVTVLAVPESASSHVPYTPSGSRDDRKFIMIGVIAALLAGLIYFALPDDLAVLREEAQSIIDALSRKDEPAPATTEPVAAPAPANEPVFPPGSTPQQIMTPQMITPAETPPAVITPVPAAVDKSSAEKTTQEKSLAAASAALLAFEVVRESWIEVRNRDNQIVFSQRLPAGSQKAVSGDGPLSLVIGYSPGVKLLWRGQSVDLEPHSRGDVARLVLE